MDYKTMIARTSTRPTFIHAAHLLLLAAALLIPSFGLAEIRLGRGDSVKAVIAGLGGLEFDAIIRADGVVDFAWLGRYDAVGKSLVELEAEIQNDTEGKIIKQYDRDGTLFIIQLEGPDVNLQHVAFSPVIVTGSVSNPGQIEFTPGMGVREAIALAGGESNRLLNIDTTIDATQVLRWQGDYGVVALDHAEAVVQGWRVEAEIAEDFSAKSPVDTATVVSNAVLDQMIQVQRKIMAVNHDTDEGERAFFIRARSQAVFRIDILGQQQEKLGEALRADEEEEARIVDLVERGLAAGSRLSDVRKSTVLSATRLLDVDNDLARSEQDVIRLDRQTAAYEEQRLRDLFTAQSVTNQAARSALLRMDVIAQYLALSGSDLATSELIAEFGLSAIIYRSVPEGKLEVIADLDTPLLPGDTVEILFEEVSLLGAKE